MKSHTIEFHDGPHAGLRLQVTDMEYKSGRIQVPIQPEVTILEKPALTAELVQIRLAYYKRVEMRDPKSRRWWYRWMWQDPNA